MKYSLFTLACLLLLPFVRPAGAAASDDHLAGDFLAFPGIIRAQTTGDDGETTFSPFVNLFYSADVGPERRVKLLAEAIITENTHEMQRLQLGWQLDDDDAIWLGRYHTPVGYWNTEYHHGQYLQTSITRPALVNFESASGVLPAHFTGLLFEGAHAFAAGDGIDYVLAAGETAVFHDHLHPADVLDPGESDGELGMALRIGYLPDAIGDNRIGAFLARSDFTTEDGGALTEIRQTAVGAYVNWRWGDFRTISEVIRIEDELRTTTAVEDGAFTSLYVQGEQRFLEKFTLFGRTEKTWNADDDAFLELLPRFAIERHAAGLRYDFKQWQALTVELAHREERAGSHNEILVQWSAVLP